MCVLICCRMTVSRLSFWRWQSSTLSQFSWYLSTGIFWNPSERLAGPPAYQGEASATRLTPQPVQVIQFFSFAAICSQQNGTSGREKSITWQRNKSLQATDKMLWNVLTMHLKNKINFFCIIISLFILIKSQFFFYFFSRAPIHSLLWQTDPHPRGWLSPGRHPPHRLRHRRGGPRGRVPEWLRDGSGARPRPGGARDRQRHGRGRSGRRHRSVV